MIKIREKTRRERIKELLNTRTKRLPLSFCIPNLNTETNFSVILRTAVALGFSNAYVIGSQGPDPKAKSAYTNDLINIKNFSNPSEFLTFCRNQEKPRIKLISFDITENSIAMKHNQRIYVHRNNLSTETPDSLTAPTTETCLCFGNESFGIAPEILHWSELVLHIPMIGPVPCMNVSAAASIAMWEFSKCFSTS